MALDFSQSWLAQPSGQKHSFEDVAGLLLRRSGDVCKMLLPAGRMAGHEYVAGDTSGARGKSLSINTRTGVWKDFASGDGGGDLISLWAAVNRTSQVEAKNDAESWLGLDGSKPRAAAIAAALTGEGE